MPDFNGIQTTWMWHRDPIPLTRPFQMEHPMHINIVYTPVGQNCNKEPHPLSGRHLHVDTTTKENSRQIYYGKSSRLVWWEGALRIKPMLNLPSSSDPHRHNFNGWNSNKWQLLQWHNRTWNQKKKHLQMAPNVKTTQKHWRLWKVFLKRWCGKSLILEEPLGKWIPNTESSQQHEFFLNEENQLF